MKYKLLIISLTILIFTSSEILPSDTPTEKKKTLKISHVQEPPIIDGILNDECWEKITPATDFMQYSPYNGQQPSEKTFVYAGYDENYLYFAFDCRDSQAEKIRAHITPRNEYYLNDEVAVYLDTYNDKRNYFYFAVNPYGIQSDSFETIWKSAGKINTNGWVAEIAIPFKSLRFSNKQQQVWGINFERTIQRLKETNYWTQVGFDDVFEEKFALLIGLEDLDPGHNIELFPYGGFRYSQKGDETEQQGGYGLDFKYSLASNVILDATVSPDYHQVESDPFFYQLSPYEYYLSERRPFFQEGSSYFYTYFDLFYSRRIQQPKIATKLTGKAGGYSFGLLGAIDKGGDEGDSYFSVIRVQKDILKYSTIGFIFTGITNDEQHNFNGGLDLDLRFKNIYYVSAQAIKTFNKGKNNNNSAYYFSFNRYPDQGISFDFFFERIEENVSTQTGFISMTDYQYLSGGVGHRWRINKKGIKSFSFDISNSYSQNTAGLKTSNVYGLYSFLQFLNNTLLSISLHTGLERSQILKEDELIWDDELLKTKYFNLFFSTATGGFIDFSIGHGRSSGPVYNMDFTAINPGISSWFSCRTTVKPKRNIEGTVSFNKRKIFLQKSKEKIFDGLIFNNSLRYQITKDLFLRLYARSDAKNHLHNFDIVVGYYFGAGNIIHFSYKDMRDNSLGDFAPLGKSFTIKLSYLLRL